MSKKYISKKHLSSEALPASRTATIAAIASATIATTTRRRRLRRGRAFWLATALIASFLASWLFLLAFFAARLLLAFFFFYFFLLFASTFIAWFGSSVRSGIILFPNARSILISRAGLFVSIDFFNSNWLVGLLASRSRTACLLVRRLSDASWLACSTGICTGT